MAASDVDERNQLYVPHEKEMKAPCKNCTDRHEACWSTCEKYIKAREDHEKAKAHLKRNGLADDFLAEAVAKVKRRANRK